MFSTGRIIAGIAFAFLVSLCGGHAATYRILHAFGAAGDGAHPMGRPTADSAGNIYGTTQEGGASGFGTVFKLGPDGVETVLHNFVGGDDGMDPNNELILDKSGNLYGVTDSGGGTGCQNSEGCGTVFKIAPDGTETVLYSFEGGGDGWFPFSGLLLDAAGNLLGTTLAGGGTACSGEGCGTVFKLTPEGVETVLYSFEGGDDGNRPWSTLIADSDGNFYGTTEQGGKRGGGTVFKISNDGMETLIHQFGRRRDGEAPQSGVAMDGMGNLYGVTSAGGIYGCGSLYQVAPDMTESVLLAFGGPTDGCSSRSVPLLDAQGNLYISTMSAKGSPGTVLKVTPEGSETVLHSFRKNGFPAAGLVADGMFNLYGMTYYGGKFDAGMLYRVTP
jgi:uncharacterized repeat protein (TIGR03803 family)